MKKIVIAIDGFSSCGKSTMAKKLAKDIGYTYVDTGAMYRAVTLYTLQNNLWIDDKKPNIPRIAEILPNINIELRNEDNQNKIYLNGVDVSEEIRGMYVSSHVSAISAIPEVRAKLVNEQQEMGKKGAIVMDGRDIGTNVFPNAELKIFVTARPEVRAERRYKELIAKGDNNTSFGEVLKNLQERDHIDANREVNPLKQADDAIVLDNSDITIAEQDAILIELFNKTISKHS